MAREASRLIAWDVLIANWDRWSGGNTFRVGQREVWLDNAAGFGRYAKEMQRKNEKPLVGVERFSRSLIGALSGVSEEQLRLALAPARLSRVQEQELMARRRDLLRYVDELVAKYGIAEVLCFD